MPLRWHVNLPGPVAYSKPVRRRGKKPGCLTTVLIWFTVKPLELMVRGTAKLFAVRSRSNTGQPLPFPEGWHHTPYGPLWWNGTHWMRPDGRVHH